MKAQNFYFPPSSGGWDTIAPSNLNWCQTKIDSLYTFLDAEQTKSFIVLKDGKIVLEAYFNGHDGMTDWIWYSAGKTMRATLIGIAQAEGHLNTTDKTSLHLGSGWSSMPQVQEDSITIWHHVTMTTGLNEQYFSCTADSCLTYKYPAGSRWYYHNAAYNLTKNILEAATNTNHNVYTQQKIKTPIGMNSGIWLPAGDNDFFFSTARDMARFGILIANKGVWNGTTVLSDTNYYSQMVNTSQSLNPSYGYLWWLNGKGSIVPPGDSLSYPVDLAPDAPSDVILAAGAQGQYISISKSTGLIMIRQGQSGNPSLIGNDLHNDIWKHLNWLECNFISVQENILKSVLYPNPTKKELTIELQKNSSVEVYSTVGEMVFKQTLLQGKTAIVLPDLSNGIYTLVVLHSNAYESHRLVISK